MLDGLRELPPSEEEIQRAKALWLAAIDSSFDDVGKTTDTFLRALVLEDGMPRIEQERAAIQRVTAAEVQGLAAKLFRLERFRWVFSGERAAASRAFEASGFGKLQEPAAR